MLEEHIETQYSHFRKLEFAVCSYNPPCLHSSYIEYMPILSLTPSKGLITVPATEKAAQNCAVGGAHYHHLYLNTCDLKKPVTVHRDVHPYYKGEQKIISTVKHHCS